MDNKKKGIFIVAIMIASIFAVVAPTGADDDVEILVINPTCEKEADKDVYEIGDTITYTMSVLNSDPEHSMTLNVTDLPPDEYPSGTPVLLQSMLELKPGESWIAPPSTYVVRSEDIVGGYVYNILRAEGYNNETPPERVEGEVELPVRIAVPTPPAVPALTPIGLIALIGLLSIVAAMSISISIKKRRR